MGEVILGNANYQLVDKHDITAEDVLGLRDASHWGTVRDLVKWKSAIDTSLATVGVRADSSELVGVGFLAGNTRQAILCDFLVHPEYRGKGIGKLILNERLKIADQLGVDYIYTELSPSNSLRQYYAEVGFDSANNMLTRASH